MMLKLRSKVDDSDDVGQVEKRAGRSDMRRRDQSAKGEVEGAAISGGQSSLLLQ